MADIANSIEDYDIIEQDDNIYTTDGIDITSGIDEEQAGQIKDKVNEARQIKQTKDLMIDIIDKDDLSVVDYDIDEADKETVQSVLQSSFKEGDIEIFKEDYDGDLSEYNFINPDDMGTP